MRRAQLGVLALALGLACGSRREPAARPAPAAARVYLGEWFDGPGGRCRVTHAERSLVEADTLPFPGARVRPDISVLDLGLACESALGAAAHSREVLPLDAFVLLQEATGAPAKQPSAAHAPRARAEDDTRDHLAFELPEQAGDVVLALRRYDARSGEPSVARERGVGTLQIRAPSLAVDVLLRPRFHDARFDALLDALAKGLARGSDLSQLAAPPSGTDAAQALSALYTQVQARFAAARFELSAAHARPEGVLAVFSLNRPQKSAESAGAARERNEVARFELDLRPDERGSFRLVGFENRDAARAALACDELEAGLVSRLAHEPAARDGQTCNVLGLLLPGGCAEADAQLIERALSVRTRCHALSAPRAKSHAPVPPADFQLTLRRGRPEVGLDRRPRYSVTLFANGQVVFHGRHFIASKERSDGRTARTLLADLYAQLRELDWFARRGDGPAASCAPSELGDVITARADGRERMVLNRAGCRNPFSEAELDELRRRVELVAGVDGFIAPPPGHVDGQVEYWTLAGSDAD